MPKQQTKEEILRTIVDETTISEARVKAVLDALANKERRLGRVRRAELAVKLRRVEKTGDQGAMASVVSLAQQLIAATCDKEGIAGGQLTAAPRLAQAHSCLGTGY